MRTFICLAVMCATTGLCASGIADDVTTNKTTTGTTTPQLSNMPESVHAMISRLSQLERAAAMGSGNHAEREKLREEIDKAGIDMTNSNGANTVVSTRRAELLSTLASLYAENGRGVGSAVNPTPKQKQAIARIREVRKDLAEAMSIPVWEGDKWIDGRSLAFNNIDLPNHVKNALVQLNFWEQNYGSLSIPEELQGVVAESGEVSAAISTFKKEIERAGFGLELDRSLCIWKIRKD
ncbi:MAG: hypothetical protein ACOX5G_00720 [Kiritimatiellia bacterium]|jgi:hypothetical protein